MKHEFDVRNEVITEYSRNWKLGDDLYPRDPILDPITFYDLILAMENENPATGRAPLQIFLDMIEEAKVEALSLFDRNFQEICAAAYDDDIEDEEEKPISDENCEALANEIRDWLLAREWWIDVRIYFNGKCYATSDENHYAYNDPDDLIVIENVDPKNYFEYVNSPNILSMTFEGPLYDAINYGSGEAEAELQAIFSRYGLYFELGNAWNLTACPL